MENILQTYDAETEGQFIIYFLDDDEDQGVYVEENDEVNYSKIIQHLNFGGSVFITRRRKPKLKMSLKMKNSKVNRINESFKKNSEISR